MYLRLSSNPSSPPVPSAGCSDFGQGRNLSEEKIITTGVCGRQIETERRNGVF